MIVQKLILDGEFTNNIQVVVRDETGIYSSSNPNGYGGGLNGNPPSKFEKYIFDLVNLYTGSSYRQIQSDNPNAVGEFTVPSIAEIVEKTNVVIDSDKFSLLNFTDGLYKLYMNVQISDVYSGTGQTNTEVITNVTGAQYLYDNYKAIIVNSEIYLIRGVVSTTLILDRPITTSFSNFKPVLRTSIDFILSDKLNDCLNGAISKFAGSCKCSNNVKNINQLAELQLYIWGINRSVFTNDISQAYEYFQLAKSLCSSLNCNCNG